MIKYNISTHSMTPLSKYRHSYQCAYCLDKQVDSEYDRDLRRCFNKPCPRCCSGRAENASDSDYGKVFKMACQWFRKTPYPPHPFETERRRIEDPKMYWQQISEELASDNFYTRERLVVKLIDLYEKFNPSPLNKSDNPVEDDF